MHARRLADRLSCCWWRAGANAARRPGCCQHLRDTAPGGHGLQSGCRRRCIITALVLVTRPGAETDGRTDGGHPRSRHTPEDWQDRTPGVNRSPTTTRVTGGPATVGGRPQEVSAAPAPRARAGATTCGRVQGKSPGTPYDTPGPEDRARRREPPNLHGECPLFPGRSLGAGRDIEPEARARAGAPGPSSSQACPLFPGRSLGAGRGTCGSECL